MRRVAPLAALLLLAGCAALWPAGAPQPRFVVYFQEQSADLDAAALKAIAGAADWARQHPAVPLTVTGFADPAGNAAGNRDLSRLRAQVVGDTLVSDGVALARIRRVAAGPVAFASTAQESRRVEIVPGAP